jgi:hypothetical protein
MVLGVGKINRRVGFDAVANHGTSAVLGSPVVASRVSAGHLNSM